MKKKSRFLARSVNIGEWFLIFIIGFFMVGVLVVGLNKKRIVKEEGLPRLSIVLNDTTLEEIHNNGKNVKYSGNKVILNDDGMISDWQNVEIKGRGNYTWWDEKKPYRLKFQDGVEMLGLSRTRKKILLTNNLDDTLIRNDMGFFLAKMVGENSVSPGEFVWLNIDDQDLGVYYMVNPVEVSKKSVDLKNEYGVLVELNNSNCELEENWYVAKSGDCLTIKDAVNTYNNEESMKLFMEKFNKLEKAAEEGHYDVVEEVADVKSMAEYFLISDFSVNPDAYVTSFYLYKDGKDDKIHAGPAWDFDSAFGNINLGLELMGEDFYNPWADDSRKGYALGWELYDDTTKSYSIVGIDNSISKLMYHLYEIPEFQDLVKDVYTQRMKGKQGEILNYLRDRARDIREDALLDMAMWNKNDFDDAVQYLEWWIEQRFDYFELKFEGIDKRTSVRVI